MMFRTLMKSKIHRATVTHADLDYIGSITLDVRLMEAADLLPNERVEIYNVTNGERFATYAIPGPRGRGDVGLNGAAAHKVSVGDLVIIAAYGQMSDQEARSFVPAVVFVDAHNRPIGMEELVAV